MNHTFNQRLVISTSPSIRARVTPPDHPDVFLINDRLEQLRFVFQNYSAGYEVYALASPGTSTLRRPYGGAAGANWD